MNKEQPLVSIITVVYNGEEYLQQTIDSVRNQTYSRLEYIIIDGGSTDNTLSIIKSNLDVVTKWISEPDNGLYDAMNKGIKMASGILIGTVNSDDWYENNAVQMVVEHFEKDNSKMIFHGDRYDVLEDDSKRLFRFNESSFKFKYYCMTYSHPTMFIHRDLFSKDGYNTALTSLADYQFVLENYLKDQSVFCYIPKPLSNFRLGGTSAQMSYLKTLKENFIARRNAGLNLIQCTFAVGIRSIGEIYRRIKGGRI